MTSAALSFHAQTARRLLPVILNNRVGPRSHLSIMSSESSVNALLRGVDVESATVEADLRSVDVADAAEIDHAVRRLRVAAAAAAFVPLSLLCVVAGIWTSSGVAMAATGDHQRISHVNSSAMAALLYCAYEDPSPLLDYCRNLDIDGIQSIDVEVWRLPAVVRQQWRILMVFKASRPNCVLMTNSWIPGVICRRACRRAAAVFRLYDSTTSIRPTLLLAVLPAATMSSVIRPETAARCRLVWRPRVS